VTPSPGIILGTGASGGLAVVGGGLLAPSLPLQVAGAQSLLSMMECKENEVIKGKLHFPQSFFPGLGFGAEEGQYYRGAIVAGIACVAIGIVGAVVFGLIRVMYHLHRRKTAQVAAEIVPALDVPEEGGVGWPRRIFTAAMSPSCLAICVSLILDSVVASSTTLLMTLADGSEGDDIFLAVIGLAVVAFIPAWTCKSLVTVGTHVHDSYYPPVVPVKPKETPKAAAKKGDKKADDDDVSATDRWEGVAYGCVKFDRAADPIPHFLREHGPKKNPESMRTKALRLFLFGNGEWRNIATNRDDLPPSANRVRVVFKAFKGPMPNRRPFLLQPTGFFFVCFLVTSASAVIRSLNFDCAVQVWILAGLYILLALFTLWLRPYVVPLANAASFVMSLGTAIGFVILGLDHVANLTNLGMIVELMATIVIVFSDLSAASSLLRGLSHAFEYLVIERRVELGQIPPFHDDHHAEEGADDKSRALLSLMDLELDDENGGGRGGGAAAINFDPLADEEMKSTAYFGAADYGKSRRDRRFATGQEWDDDDPLANIAVKERKFVAGANAAPPQGHYRAGGYGVRDDYDEFVDEYGGGGADTLAQIAVGAHRAASDHFSLGSDATAAADGLGSDGGGWGDEWDESDPLALLQETHGRRNIAGLAAAPSMQPGYDPLNPEESSESNVEDYVEYQLGRRRQAAADVDDDGLPDASWL
jgi:hypothetical protein